jgi:hypothetical protein
MDLKHVFPQPDTHCKIVLLFQTGFKKGRREKVALKGCFVDFLTRKQYPVKNTRRLEDFYDTGLATAFGKN